MSIEQQRQAGRKYHERWNSFRLLGNQPVVLSRSQQPQQWSAWRRYFQLHDLAVPLDLMDAKSETTVPCLNPADFDMPAAAPDRRVKDD